MKTKAEVVKCLGERQALIKASPFCGSKSHRESIQRTLDALDSPYSYYAVLSPEEREEVRADLMDFATCIGVKCVKRRASRAAQPLPSKLLEFFGDGACLPHRPRATDNPRDGTKVVSWDRAQNLRHVELNSPTHFGWLVFDCDHHDYELWQAAGLPQPSFITVNPQSGNHHVVYRLTSPVCRSSRARARPLTFFYAVYEGIREALKADACYTRGLTQNPVHSAWLVKRPITMPEYRLAELAATVDLGKASASNGARARMRRETNLGEVEVGGRNQALFDEIRAWAYRNQNHLENMLEFAERSNEQLAQPLGFSEVKAIVGSIQRYLNGSHKKRSSSNDFSIIQAQRGRLGGRPRTTMNTQPWKSADISRATWYHRRKTESTHLESVQRGRPVTTRDTKPWLASGVSRATWYRQQKKSS